MADHSKPTLTSTYSNFVTEMDARYDDLAVGLDPAVTTATNVPTNSIRWSSANNTWQKYNSTSWVALSSLYSISISGNSATATSLATARNINGVSFNGTASISINLNTSVTFNNSGTGNASGITFDGSSPRTISYNTLGSPSVTGTNASGTWGINVTGNAATATTSGKLTTTNWLVEENGGVLQIKTIGGLLKFSMDNTNGFTVY